MTAGSWQFVLIGLVIGSLYALIALGYTMVYGIIELINFAHGDLFMLGSFLALQLGRLARRRDRGREPRSATRSLGIGLMLVAAPLFCAALNVVGGPRRLQAAPRRPQAGPARLGHRGVSFIFMNIGLFWIGRPSTSNFPDLVPDTNLRRRHAALRFTGKDVMVLARHRPGDGRADAVRAVHAARARRCGRPPRTRPRPSSWASTSTG